MLTPAGGDVHHWEPSPQDMQTLEQADVFIYNGAGLESWVEEVLGSLSNPDLVVVEAASAEGLPDLQDPHIWADPVNAIAIVSLISDTLQSADPEQQDAYRMREDRFVTELEELNQDFEEQLAPFIGQTILMNHESFGYVAARHGLIQEGMTGLHDEGEPSPQRMAELADEALEKGIKTIFVEPQSNRDTANALAAEIGGEVAVLDPLASYAAQGEAADEDPGAPGSYVRVLRSNLATLVAALTMQAA